MIENKTPAYSFWKIISDVFNPATALTLYFAYANFSAYPYDKAINRLLLLLGVVVLPVFGFILYKVKKGKFTNIDVSDRKQRKILYIFILVFVMLYTGLDRLLVAHYDTAIICGLSLLIILQISNFFIKSSMHTAFNVFTCFLWFKEHNQIFYLWVLITLMVGVSRYYLKRHSISEIISGAGIAILLGGIYLVSKV